jgi:hypothetical protein
MKFGPPSGGGPSEDRSKRAAGERSRTRSDAGSASPPAIPASAATPFADASKSLEASTPVGGGVGPYPRVDRESRGVHRRVLVHCPVCGRSLERRACHQTYCGNRCRKRAAYARGVAEGKFFGGRYPYSGDGTNPSKIASNRNALRGPKSGSSTDRFAPAPLNILGGGEWSWPGTPKLDARTKTNILRAEIGGEIVKPHDPMDDQ